MHPSRRPCFYASLALFVFLAYAPRTTAETLIITSSPSGATVELDGITVGTTPYQVKYPGGYFHKTKSVFGDRLEHAVVLRLHKDGYAPQEIQLTDGPFEWVNLKGKNYGHYWLFKTNKLDVALEPVARQATGVASAGSAGLKITSATQDREAASAAPPAANPVSPTSPAPAVSSAGDGSVEIASDQPGAEIYVDGQFVGQTPATIRLPSGAHKIELKSPGGVPWQRDLNILKDSQISLHATLAQPH